MNKNIHYESGESMKLKVSNVAKIKEAVIKVDGITVIAGENNAGKSTIGKLLFAIYNAMYNMEEKIAQEKRNKIREIIFYFFQNEKLYQQNNYANFSENRYRYYRWSEKIAEYVFHMSEENVQDDSEALIQVLLEGLRNVEVYWNEEQRMDFSKACADKLEPILKVSDQKVMLEVISRWFGAVFEGQISPLREEGIESEIELEIKDSTISYVFRDNVCINLEAGIGILHEAFYIDNPFVLDAMSHMRYANAKRTERHLLNFLCNEKEDVFDGIFNVVTAKEKLKEINDLLGEVIKGEFVQQEGEYCLTAPEYTKPLSIKNMSTGMKSFALIKRLLENAAIKEKDVLILDEPEIHLHPEWQLLYAELIVLLQKQFDLSMVITTHSPYFLDAIDIYSQKYETANRVNFYLAENDGNTSSLSDVTGNIDRIYQKLSDPMQKLENLRYNVI